jgi:pimeloyl-ACP methyl ester carboxylesterase
LAYNLHGWEKQYEYFGSKSQFTVCVFDNRGSGLSEPVSGRYTTSELAKDAGELLDFLGWTSNIHLIGVSMGGMIAKELILMRKSNFISSVLTSTYGILFFFKKKKIKIVIARASIAPITFRVPKFLHEWSRVFDPSHPLSVTLSALFPQSKF